MRRTWRSRLCSWRGGAVLLTVVTVNLAWTGSQEVRPVAAADAGEVNLLMPIMRPERGRHLFASKGCVVCHSINGVGGKVAPALDASRMPGPMNPFDFVAKMWRGAPAMIALQRHELGAQIQFTGEELADIIAFVHDPAEQRKFTKKDLPPQIRKRLEHGD